MSTLLADFFTAIDAVFISFFATGAARVAGAMRPIFNTLVTIYVFLWGFAQWRGLIDEPLSDGVMRVVKIVLIGTFALNMGVYTPQISTAIFRTPDRLAAVLVPGAGTASTGSALDASLDMGVDVGRKFVDAVTWTEPIQSLVLMIEALMVWIFTTLLVGFAAALILLAKITLSVVLALGPIFVAMLLFEPTRQFFNGWLGQALNGLFTYVVAVAFVALGLNFFDAAATATLASLSGGVTPILVDVLRMFIVGVAVLVALWQAGPVASALAGGVQVGTMGMVGWSMRQGANALTSPLRGARGLRNMNDRRLTRDYYRRSMGLQPTMTTRSLDWMRARIRGGNAVSKN